MHWVDAGRAGAWLMLGALLAGCAADAARPGKPATTSIEAATTLAAPPTAVPPDALPPDSLLIVISARNAYTVQNATTTCQGLPALLQPYREQNLVVAGHGGFAATIADALCIATIAKARGGKAYLMHPEGLRTIEVED
ncbi:MAG: hypothetical protein JNN30_16190 [Rhodanobacteraceae bacterium]|nr:hypothetical protein [Rhodanobacteraceae bacterium]